MPLAKAWAVFGFFCRNSLGAYKQLAGMGPPNKAKVPFIVRVSTIVRTSPLCSSMVIMGSMVLTTSIWPERMAVITPVDVPTPTKLTSSGLISACANTSLANMWVEEPIAETPIFLFRRSAQVL